ncbi:uncharacterized protein LOC135812654 [Sycon ciliatum]|uniref:uncharacterized protein LOC135812654 n=1 Tax=Sycon ciliatum TaxID=27933 RepID=UPI0031F7045A
MAFSRSASVLRVDFRACWHIAVFVFLQVHVGTGQYPVLVAAGTGQGTPFIMTFGDGQSTADVLSYMPVCIVTSGSAPFIRLEKTDGSLVLGVTGSFTGFGRAPLNTTAHPSLNASYTGVYHCRTDARYSPQLYQLNVVARQIRSSFPTSLPLVYMDGNHTISCMSSGNFPLKLSWNTTLSPDSELIRTMTSANIVHSTFSFKLNDPQFVITERDTSGVAFNVTCKTWYTTHFDCVAVGSIPARPHHVIQRCLNSSQAVSTSVSVIIQVPRCSALHTLNLNVNVTSSTPSKRGSIVNVQCIPPYNLTNGVQQVTCLANGFWTVLPTCVVTHCASVNHSTITYLPRTPIGASAVTKCREPYSGITGPNNVQCMAAGIWSTLPTCPDIDECITGDHNCSEKCTNAQPGYVCNCFNGTAGCFVTHCAAVNQSTVGYIERRAIGQTATVECRRGYDSLLGPTAVTCMASGKWSELPTCHDIDECSMEEKPCALYCTNLTPGFMCTCVNGTVGCFAQQHDKMCNTEQPITIEIFVGALAASLLFGSLITFLLTRRVCGASHLDTKGSEIPPESTRHDTPNIAYENAEIGETVMTSSEAYVAVGAGDTANYLAVLP